MRLLDRFTTNPQLVRATTIQTTGNQLPNPILDPTSAHAYPLYVQEGLKGSGPIYTLIAIRANTIAEVRFKWRDDLTDAFVSVDGLQRLTNPWRNGTLAKLLKRVEVDISLAGNSYVRALPGNRVEVLRPDWVIIVLNRNDITGTVDLGGYIYHPDGMQGSRPPILLPPAEIAHLTGLPDPLHPFRGMSWMTPIARDVDTDTHMVKHKATFFTNAATPLMKLTVDTVLDKEARDRLKATFAQRYEGPDNAHRTIFLEGGADLEVIGTDFRSIRFESVQAAGEARIAAAAGVPPIVAGMKAGLDTSTYNNYNSAVRSFVDVTLRPKWRDIAGDLASIVSGPSGSHLWYDDSDIALLQQDAKDEAEINSRKALTLESLIRGGFSPDSAIIAVVTGKFDTLVHTGLVSVQLQPPVTGEPSGLDDDTD